MRLWHKDLIEVLPRQQLIAQWRECCCIAKNIAEKGTPNHILVNKVTDYPPNHFFHYTELILDEIHKRGYRTTFKSVNNFLLNMDKISENYHTLIKKEDIFKEWHNDRYLTQCYYNLQEKYDCIPHKHGGLTQEEWKKINDKYIEIYTKKIRRANR